MTATLPVQRPSKVGEPAPELDGGAPVGAENISIGEAGWGEEPAPPGGETGPEDPKRPVGKID